MVLSQASFRYGSSSFTATQMLLCNAQLRKALVFSRLQMLEQQVVGWEEAENEDLNEDEEKHKRQKFADEQRMQLVTVLQKSDNDSSDLVLLNIYDSVQEEV